ncbi:hypothetical protein A0H81_06687 [Grifola frondosa]|uniref:F-box domain-containing protein n=1 Tax=Grifola frondosa TaxID=5627 RepID=A0A1C7M750_GRIFR|nr:hypothetical protein A0H81_06687 [Grifola frondosa]
MAPRSRRHLFQCITIKRFSMFQRFKKLLEHSPGISVYIQAMVLHDGVGGAPCWITDCIYAIPTSVTSRIQSLSLEGLYWEGLYPEAHEFFATQFPAVENFSLAGTVVSISHFNGLVNSFPRLSSLAVRDIGWNWEESELEDTQRPHHDGLHIDFLLLLDDTLFSWIIGGHLAPGVRRLEIKQNDRHDVTVICGVLQYIGPSLEELHIHFADPLDEISFHKSIYLRGFTLAQNTHLHSLRFSLKEVRNNMDQPDYLFWANRFLLKVRSQIRSIQFTIAGVDHRPNRSYWPSINAALRMEAFKSLEEVSVVTDESLVNPQEAEEAYTSYLSVAKERGVLRFEHTNRLKLVQSGVAVPIQWP